MNNVTRRLSFTIYTKFIISQYQFRTVISICIKACYFCLQIWNVKRCKVLKSCYSNVCTILKGHFVFQLVSDQYQFKGAIWYLDKRALKEMPF